MTDCLSALPLLVLLTWSTVWFSTPLGLGRSFSYQGIKITAWLATELKAEMVGLSESTPTLLTMIDLRNCLGIPRLAIKVVS